MTRRRRPRSRPAVLYLAGAAVLLSPRDRLAITLTPDGARCVDRRPDAPGVRRPHRANAADGRAQRVAESWRGTRALLDPPAVSVCAICPSFGNRTVPGRRYCSGQHVTSGSTSNVAPPLCSRRGRRFRRRRALARIVAREVLLAPPSGDDRLPAGFDTTRLVPALRQLAALPRSVVTRAVSLPAVGGSLAAGLPAPGGWIRHLGSSDQSVSRLRPRVIRPITAWSGGLSSYSRRCICSVIGISTPTLCARACTERVLCTPSATSFMLATMSRRRSPRPSRRPTVRFRDRSPVQVSTRSPSPESPASVCRSAPSWTARRVISARPRVISAARVLWPNPRPSLTPAASAITFFTAPPISTPTT